MTDWQGAGDLLCNLYQLLEALRIEHQGPVEPEDGVVVDGPFAVVGFADGHLDGDGVQGVRPVLHGHPAGVVDAGGPGLLILDVLLVGHGVELFIGQLAIGVEEGHQTDAQVVVYLGGEVQGRHGDVHQEVAVVHLGWRRRWCSPPWHRPAS